MFIDFISTVIAFMSGCDLDFVVGIWWNLYVYKWSQTRPSTTSQTCKIPSKSFKIPDLFHSTESAATRKSETRVLITYNTPSKIRWKNTRKWKSSIQPTKKISSTSNPLQMKCSTCEANHVEYKKLYPKLYKYFREGFCRGNGKGCCIYR